MNTVVMVGVSHRTASLPLLERVAVPAARRADVLEAVRATDFTEAVLLATCSRTEIYASGQADPGRLVDILAGAEDAASVKARRAVVVRTGEDVATHLFRVAAGLESRVVGEPEIRCQVRTAFRDACDAGAAGGVLGEMFAAAVRAADRVHEETAFGSASRSLASRAVQIGLSHTVAARPVVVVVGSGRMASAAVHQLGLLGHRPVVVARDANRATRLAGAVHARPLSELGTMMAAADVVICATSAYEPLVTVDDVRRAMFERTAPLTLVDLSVPRNVDPAVADVDNVRLVDLEAMHDRPGELALTEAVAHAEALVGAAIQQRRDHLAARRAGPLIAAMRARVESRCLEAVHALAPSTCSDGELARLAHTIAGRLAHPATMAARAAAAAGDDVALLTICDAFDVTLTPETLGLGVPSGSPTQVSRDRDPRREGWLAPLGWTDGIGQADPGHLRLRGA